MIHMYYVFMVVVSLIKNMKRFVDGANCTGV